MFPVWTQVIVKTEGHARYQTAGYVVGTNEAFPGSVVVKFDNDGTNEAVDIADLKAL